jgi:hypothetical protein
MLNGVILPTGCRTAAESPQRRRSEDLKRMAGTKAEIFHWMKAPKNKINNYGNC